MTATRETRIPRLPILGLFFLSGGCGLIYEIVWTRLLTLVMGSTIYSISTVLTAFMGGLALGSFIAGRIVTARSNGIRLYGILEIIIGVYCLFIPSIIDLFIPFYRSIYPSLANDHFLFSLIRFAVSFSILLVPTTLMGATLPILTGYLARRPDRLGGTIGTVYAVNTLGAVLGSFGAGFLLLPLLGTWHSIVVTGLTNITIGATALLYARRAGRLRADATVPPRDIPVEGEGRRPVLTLLLLAFAVSGFAAMVYQVIWTRMLTLMIGSSTYAFSLIVTAFILGIGIGSMALSRFIDRREDLFFGFALAELVIAASAVAIVFVFGKLPFVIVEIIDRYKASFSMIQFIEFALILSLLLVPTTLMGVLFPLVARIYTRNLSMVGRAVGNAYAANTLGAIVGSFTAGFLFIPFLGMERGILVALVLNLGIGAVFLFVPRRGNIARRAVLCTVWVFCTLGAFIWTPSWNREWITMGPYMYFTEYQRQLQHWGEDIRNQMERYNRLIYFREGVSATVSIRKSMTGTLSLQINGKTDASTGPDMATQMLLAHVPMLLNRSPENVLVIGLASGVTVGSVETYPVSKITCVEISPEMIDAAKIFAPYNGSALDDPRLRILIEDGRNHVLLSRESYDVIISEPTNPWISGVGSLFTEEYFRLLDRRLREGGTACVWLQAYGLEPADFRMIARTFLKVFPNASLWEPLIGKDYLLVGTKGPFEIDPDRMEERIARPEVGRDLARIGVRSPLDLLKYFIMGPPRLESFAGNGMIHTDDNSKLEFSTPKSLYENTIPKQLAAIAPHRESPVSYADTTGSCFDRDRFESVRKARALAVRANEAAIHGDFVTSENLLHMALAENPDEPAARELSLRHNANVIVKLLETGNMRELERVARASLELDPLDFPALDGLSLALLTEGRAEEATDLLERAARAYPDYAAFHGRLGYVLAGQDRTPEAVAAYRTATAKDPGNARYAYDLGVLSMNAGDLPRALESFERAVRIDPGFLEAHINLGGVRARLGRIEEARESFRNALAIDPDNEIATRNLARLE